MMNELQKQLHEEYREQLRLAWSDEHMVDYCTKKAEIVVKTSDGYLLEVERQNIKKRFCFGHGYCGVTTQEEMDDASKMAKHARTNQDYFIKENLEWYDSWIKEIEENGAYISIKGKYYSQTEDCLLRGFQSGRSSWYNRIENNPDYRKMPNEDTQQLLDAFKEARESMKKRLNTYLKKYGLSKLHVWTYLVD